MSLVRRIGLDATRTEVWDAVATGPGLSAWYVPHELESRRGGLGRADFGGGTIVEGRVAVYEPGQRIALRAEPEPEPDTGLEFWIVTSDDDPEGVPGGSADGLDEIRSQFREPTQSRTTLYFRQQGFPEAEQAVYEAGWDVHFHTLTEYFKYFAPKPSATTAALVLHPSIGRVDAFQRIVQSLGATHEAEVGQELSLQPRGRAGETITGVVDLRMSNPHLEALGLRTETGFLRAMSDESCGSTFVMYDYAVDPVPEADRQLRSASWQSWLTEQFAA